MDTSFIGRETELDELRSLLKRKQASLMVIKGRRRIGKSRLIYEFAKGRRVLFFTGLPPTQDVTPQDQRVEFARQLAENAHISLNTVPNDWGDLFTLLAKTIQKPSKGKVIVVFDEISWMGSEDPLFLGKLKVVWELHFERNPSLILILCGSHSTWIEKNILSSTGFFGRIASKITLKELSIPYCNTILTQCGFRGSMQERLMYMAVTGGVPWYLELIKPSVPVLETLRSLCFSADGILVDEFKYIFHDLFGDRSKIYQAIVEYLVDGAKDYDQIAKGINYASGGPLSDYLNDLVTVGYISRDPSWSLALERPLRKNLWRLSDNYLRFHLKYILPRLHQIKVGQASLRSPYSLPGWESIMGLQFENLVVNNYQLLWKAISLRPEHIVFSNPFHQKGCQIDYLIQTRFKTIYLCEVKFSKNPINVQIIPEIEAKVKALRLPKGYVCLPVLIHIHGVTEELEGSGYFSHIVDFGSF